MTFCTAPAFDSAISWARIKSLSRRSIRIAMVSSKELYQMTMGEHKTDIEITKFTTGLPLLAEKKSDNINEDFIMKIKVSLVVDSNELHHGAESHWLWQQPFRLQYLPQRSE